MARVEINPERCKACELCIIACPKGLLRLSKEYNSFGDHYAEQADAAQCVGCALCGIACPDTVITVYK